MKRKILILILSIAKWSGLFAIARYVTTKDLRILCYHGAALVDENNFRPGLFISQSTFAQRMEYLDKHKYPILDLENALQKLEFGGLPKNATVITIDDGWFGTYKIMAPILANHQFPATLYVASYYLEKQTQVFNVAIAYVAWRTKKRTINLSEVDSSLDGKYRLDVHAEHARALKLLNEFAETLDGSEERQALLRKFCDVLEYDWRFMESNHLIRFMTKEDARELLRMGVDIQMHTHRHKFPDTTFEAIKIEVVNNEGERLHILELNQEQRKRAGR